MEKDTSIQSFELEKKKKLNSQKGKQKIIEKDEEVKEEKTKFQVLVGHTFFFSFPRIENQEEPTGFNMHVLLW